MSRERALEQELVAKREMLDAYSNEEVRIGRLVLTREATRAELESVTLTVEMLVLDIDRLTRELKDVRAEIIWRGERRKVVPHDPNQGPIWPLWLGALFFASFVGAALLYF